MLPTAPQRALHGHGSLQAIFVNGVVGLANDQKQSTVTSQRLQGKDTARGRFICTTCRTTPSTVLHRSTIRPADGSESCSEPTRKSASDDIVEDDVLQLLSRNRTVPQSASRRTPASTHAVEDDDI